jgi:hypothetical protein
MGGLPALSQGLILVAVCTLPLAELLARGHTFVIADNRYLRFASDSVDEVSTNSVPIDQATHLGPGVQSSEIIRILKSGGNWFNNGTVVYVKP